MKRGPVEAQQPAPVYLNDATGYWGAVLSENRVSGLASLLPTGTALQSDTAVKGRLLDAQIKWTPTQARWKGAVFAVSISDAQFFLAVESGGDTQQGRLTVLVNKLQFNGGAPSYKDTLSILAGNKWHEFVIAEIVGQHDNNEPSLTLYLDKDQNDYGD